MYSGYSLFENSQLKFPFNKIYYGGTKWCLIQRLYDASRILFGYIIITKKQKPFIPLSNHIAAYFDNSGTPLESLPCLAFSVTECCEIMSQLLLVVKGEVTHISWSMKINMKIIKQNHIYSITLVFSCR